jgi:hypothetical protein
VIARGVGVEGLCVQARILRLADRRSPSRSVPGRDAETRTILHLPLKEAAGFVQDGVRINSRGGFAEKAGNALLGGLRQRA